MRLLPRHAVCSVLALAASLAAPHAAAGVLTQDGVIFTSTYTGNVLTLEIDAAKRSGAWAAATALDGFSIKTIGSFSGVSMTTASGGDWKMTAGELNASGCAAARTRAGATSPSRLCFSGENVALADNMLFTFTFAGTPTLSAPHLKVHFVDAKGTKVGSLLSLGFPAQGPTAPVITPPVTAIPTPTAPVTVPVTTTPTVPDPALIPQPSLGGTGATEGGGNNVPVLMPAAVDAATVPEPQSGAMLAAGLALILVVRRRSRKPR